MTRINSLQGRMGRRGFTDSRNQRRCYILHVCPGISVFDRGDRQVLSPTVTLGNTALLCITPKLFIAYMNRSLRELSIAYLFFEKFRIFHKLSQKNQISNNLPENTKPENIRHAIYRVVGQKKIFYTIHRVVACVRVRACVCVL